MTDHCKIMVQLQDGQSPITTNPSSNACLAPPAKKLPTTNSHDFRVLGIGPPVVFDCLIVFTIYFAEKTKQNTTNWVALCQLSDLSVTFIANKPLTWQGFQNLVADQCNTYYNYSHDPHGKYAKGGCPNAKGRFFGQRNEKNQCKGSRTIEPCVLRDGHARWQLRVSAVAAADDMVHAES
ncbi:hypothetical protein VP01_1041g5 [Puccinia sorghi]|uniref:Uncharacterized protein n=1 Tax=Puccinia sorghi TaxID=27349 RepID=A0A0L6VVQ1_9BASI|nr:hypothetical protein VP01_1041g5 [Puccinia sorghi]